MSRPASVRLTEASPFDVRRFDTAESAASRPLSSTCVSRCRALHARRSADERMLDVTVHGEPGRARVGPPTTSHVAHIFSGRQPEAPQAGAVPTACSTTSPVAVLRRTSEGNGSAASAEPDENVIARVRRKGGRTHRWSVGIEVVRDVLQLECERRGVGVLKQKGARGGGE